MEFDLLDPCQLIMVLEHFGLFLKFLSFLVVLDLARGLTTLIRSASTTNCPPADLLHIVEHG